MPCIQLSRQEDIGWALTCIQIASVLALTIFVWYGLIAAFARRLGCCKLAAAAAGRMPASNQKVLGLSDEDEGGSFELHEMPRLTNDGNRRVTSTASAPVASLASSGSLLLCSPPAITRSFEGWRTSHRIGTGPGAAGFNSAFLRFDSRRRNQGAEQSGIGRQFLANGGGY